MTGLPAPGLQIAHQPVRVHRRARAPTRCRAPRRRQEGATVAMVVSWWAGTLTARVSKAASALEFYCADCTSRLGGASTVSWPCLVRCSCAGQAAPPSNKARKLARGIESGVRILDVIDDLMQRVVRDLVVATRDAAFAWFRKTWYSRGATGARHRRVAVAARGSPRSRARRPPRCALDACTSRYR